MQPATYRQQPQLGVPAPAPAHLRLLGAGLLPIQARLLLPTRAQQLGQLLVQLVQRHARHLAHHRQRVGGGAALTARLLQLQPQKVGHLQRVELSATAFTEGVRMFKRVSRAGMPQHPSPGPWCAAQACSFAQHRLLAATLTEKQCAAVMLHKATTPHAAP